MVYIKKLCVLYNNLDTYDKLLLAPGDYVVLYRLTAQRKKEK